MTRFTSKMVLTTALTVLASLACGSYANAQNVRGPYQIGNYKAGSVGVRYFAVVFHGEFTWKNMEAAARAGRDYVQKNHNTHITKYIGKEQRMYQKHMVIGLVTTAGDWHWTAMRAVGKDHVEWVNSKKKTGFKNGWVCQDVRISSGKVVRYQFINDVRNQMGWEIKHFARD